MTGGLIVGMLSGGHDRDEVLQLYPYLTSEDIDAALSYAAWRADEFEESTVRIMSETIPVSEFW